MTTGIDYRGLSDEYAYRYRSKYGTPCKATTTTKQETTSSSLQGAGFFENKCTDGKDDGKIGVGSVILNIGEGILKGIWNGVVGAVTDSEGNISLGKILLSAGVVAACAMCPALGAVACGIGAVSGAAQVVKGAKVAANATTDAEAKAAWENIGEGGSTVVGCALGVKASLGAMKGASTAAMTADDIAKATDDITKALGNIDDISNALKNHGFSNVDDIMKSVDDISKLDAGDIMQLVKSKGGASQLSKVSADDSLHGVQKLTQTAKALMKDAASSTKNNVGKAWTKFKTVRDDIKDYRSKKKTYKTYKNKMDEYKKARDEFNEQNVGKKLSSQEQQTKIQELRDKESEVRQLRTELDDTKIGKRLTQRAANGEAIDKAKGTIDDAQKAVDDALDAIKNSDEVKGLKGKKQKAKIAELTEATKGDPTSDLSKAQKALQDAQKSLADAKSQTTFGKLTTTARTTVENSETYKYFREALKSGKMGDIIKSLNPLDVIPKLGYDGAKVFNYLKDGKNIPEAIKQFGYDNVMEVLKVVYAYGQTNQTV